MAQTQLIPEAVKSTILFKLRSYEASIFASVALFQTVKTTVCIRASRFYLTLSVSWTCSFNATGAKINSSWFPAVYFFLRCARPFSQLIFVSFPWKKQEARNASVTSNAFAQLSERRWHCRHLALYPVSLRAQWFFLFVLGFFSLFNSSFKTCRRLRGKVNFIKILLIRGECRAKRLFILPPLLFL